VDDGGNNSLISSNDMTILTNKHGYIQLILSTGDNHGLTAVMKLSVGKLSFSKTAHLSL
jgi:hypothetical protein